MKSIFYIIAGIISISLFFQKQTEAQVPEKMSYQAVVRDENNNLVTNSIIGIQISILQGSVTGEEIFIERFQLTSNSNGLVTLEIGTGLMVAGELKAIDWSNGPYFLKTETDPTGGFNFTISGTSQLLSVPFALHAKTAESISGADHIIDSIVGNYLASGITAADTSKWNNKLDSLKGNENVFEGWDKNAADDFDGSYTKLFGKPTKVSHFTNDAGYLKNENDPVFNESVAAGITRADTAAWNAASIGSYIEADPVFMAWDKSSGISITKSQITDLSYDVFEKELTNGENNIDVGFSLLTTSVIFINGVALPSSEWSGTGTQILYLNMKTKLYDKLKVKK